MVVLDSTMLLLFLRPDTPVPSTVSGRPIEFARDRVTLLIEEIEKSGTRIIIPTPVLSEILVRAEARDAQDLVDRISKYSVFRLAAFDVLAAIEVGAMSRDSVRAKRDGHDAQATWAKLKFDRQIVAIARVNQASRIYSDDKDVRVIAERCGIPVTRLEELPVPPAKAQRELPLA